MTRQSDAAITPGPAHHIDSSLTGAEHDRPWETGEPERHLFLCTTPRSGSHRLGRALFTLGIGCPAEYFHPSVVSDLAQRWQVPHAFASHDALRAYWQRVCALRRQQGTVAASLFAYQIRHLAALGLPADRSIHIHLRRRKLGQQVASLITLYRTKRPFDGEEEVSFIPDLNEISPRAIRILGQWIKMQNRRWEAFLADKPHVTVISEDFFARPDVIVPQVLDACGLAASPAAIDALLADLRASGSYNLDSDEKRRLLAEFAADFAALDREGQRGV
ncbi:MAG: hypothetical protein IT550_10655 [Novosphingobium sp.]|nr:hypothetical protein [Novosphingobium sp.]